VRIWSAVAAEALGDLTPVLVAGLVLTIIMVRLWAPAERRRVRAMFILTALHLITMPIAGVLRAVENKAHDDVRLACLIFGVLAAVGMVNSILFAIVLPKLGVRTPRILREVIGATIGIVALIFVAQKAGFSLTGLITTSAVLTAVIGFSMQDTLGNIMGGLALQMDNSVKVGDWVKVGDVSGRLLEIRWRYTSIETRNWETVIIPNSVLMKGQVTVVAKREGQPALWRRWVWFNVDFRYQPSDVMQVVAEALQAAPIESVSAQPAPQCILMDLHESYARYAVRYWLSDPGRDDPTDSDVRTRVFFALKRAGIPLSMPAHAVFLTEETADRKVEKKLEERTRRAEALEHVTLFNPLPPEDIARLADQLRYAPFCRGETMTRQGAEAHWLYVLVEGEAAVRVSVEGHEKEVARLRAGQFFGEMSLMTGERRSATVVALTDVECFRLDKAAFQEVMTARPEIATHIAEVLARRRVELQAVREGLDAEAREKRMVAVQADLLHKIRDFFGLVDHRRAAG
jgi:small-conductance mechanosensitive channel/CRP-like cAMP-binding protein